VFEGDVNLTQITEEPELAISSNSVVTVPNPSSASSQASLDPTQLEVPQSSSVLENPSFQIAKNLPRHFATQGSHIRSISDIGYVAHHCYCSNPSCYAENPLQAEQCLVCGHNLQLHKRYRVLQFLAKGRFGTTLLARDETLPGQPKCVIKRLYAMTVVPKFWEAERDFFRRESNALSKIGSHPQIPRLLDYFSIDRDFFLVQELVSGLTLEQEVTQQGAFTETQVRQFLQEFLPILAYIHNNQIIHRDIKPANIIRRTEDGRLVLLGFGASRDVGKPSEDTTLATHALSETNSYIPPEQQARRPTFASDIYSLGVTCIYLLSRKHPKNLGFNDVTGEMKWRENVEVSKNFAVVLEKMMELSCRHRYQSVEELSRALDLDNDLKNTSFAPAEEALSSAEIAAKADRIREMVAKIRARRKASCQFLDEEHYINLRNLLLANQWKIANQKTWLIILTLANRANQGWISINDVEILPSEAIAKLDQLWLKYSNGRFGFSMQKQLWQEVVREVDEGIEAIDRFSDRVGWRQGGKWRDNDSLTFSIEAPEGHLPGWSDAHYPDENGVMTYQPRTLLIPALARREW
jgi:serine/threonine protein kinase